MKWIKITKDTIPTKGGWYITRRQFTHDNPNDWGDILQINFDPKFDDSNRFLQHYPKNADVFYLDEFSGSEPEGKEAVELLMYDTINNELVELGTPKEVMEYVKENFIDGDTAHPDFWGFDLFVKVGKVDENNRVVLNSDKNVHECDATEASSKRKPMANKIWKGQK